MMHFRNILLGCLFWIVMVSCMPVNNIDKELTLHPPSIEPPIPNITPVFETEIPATLPIQPPPGIPSVNETESSWKGDQMPAFLEVTRTTIINTNNVQSPTLGVGPIMYFYTPGDKILLVHSMVKLDLKTEIMIGVAEILQMPGQVFDQREIVQYPSAQPTLVQISSFDRETGKTELVYGDERFALLPGENRTFKQAGNSESAAVITIISNYGRLIDIQPIESDGSLR